MKKIPLSLKMTFGFLILIVVATLLPWVRLNPAGPERLVQKLTSSEEGWVATWITMRQTDWQALTKDPVSGATGYQLLLWAEEDTAEGKLTRLVADLVWGEGWGKWMMKGILVGPLLSIFLFIQILQSFRGRWVLLTGCSLILYYMIARWKLDAAYHDMLLGQITWSIGLWLQIYSCLILGLVALVRGSGFAPKF
ncbi:MAG: hypothetical protein AAFY98_00795 [Verrucomicrobiota bacterium]